MKMKTPDSLIVNSYWGLIESLDTNRKLDLIEKLTQSIKQNLQTKPNTMKNAFGAWESYESAENIIQQLRDSRSTRRQIEEL